MDETDKRLASPAAARRPHDESSSSRAKANLSQATAFERIKRLQRDGVIEGYTVKLNPAKLDRNLLIFVEITLDRTTQTIFEDALCSRRSPRHAGHPRMPCASRRLRLSR